MWRKKPLHFSIFITGFTLAFLSFRCSSPFGHFEQKPVAAPADSVLFTSAPVLSPAEALQTFQLEEGFEMALVASEPLIQDPVALDFDPSGRLWVVEMRGFMTDLASSGQEQPSGRIVILEDVDGDGSMDKAKVFMDSLVLPRAISILNNGVLIAEPPNLWFVENNADRAGKKMLVDAAYALDGNVEHQPNGLMRGIDNWYYSAKSSARYRYKDGQWLKEETEFRGQWGITKDNYGRMFYNTNSSQLRGDLAPPNMLLRNPEAPLKQGINRNIAEDQSLYPIRPTPGVNRGYLEDFLDEEQKLKRFTAACGPVIYRGNQYPKAYAGNAFVCEPAANLIKRNVLQQNGAYLKATQAYSGREFLASKDERFRPVNLYNAPDGSLYVVDMYRGIIQDKVYLTKYLEDQIRQRNLVKPLGMGRIYRIAYKEGSWFQRILSSSSSQPVDLHKARPEQLVTYLSHPNGWWRDTAQRLLVEGNHQEVVPELQKLLKQGPPLAQIHVLWTLEGMGIYDPATIRPALASTNSPEVVATAIRVADRNAKTGDFEASLALYKEVLKHPSSLVQLQLALSLGEFIQKGSTKALHMLTEVTLPTQGDSLMNDAILSSVYGKEEKLLSLLQRNKTKQYAFISYLQKSISRGTEKKVRQLEGISSPEVKGTLSLGKSLYVGTCSGCHQKGGEGLVPIAPPLKGSQWVTGPAEPLISLILHGLKGPVTVNGKIYQEPDIQPYMPGFKDNPELTDAHIAAIINYMRKAWSSGIKEVSATEVKEVRDRTKNRARPYTEKELIGTAAPH